MSLDLEPGQYLEMLKAEHEEHKKNPVSMRKVITCCALSKMPDIVFTEYGSTEPQKVHGAKGHADYLHLGMRSATDLNPIDPACSSDRLAWIAVP